MQMNWWPGTGCTYYSLHLRWRHRQSGRASFKVSLWWNSKGPTFFFFFSHREVLSYSKFAGEGLTSACLMGHLAKYNLKPPPHGHAQAFNCTPSVNTLAHTLFLPAARTLQQAHLQSFRTAPAHTLISQHTINTLVRRQFIHARHSRRLCVPFLSHSKTNYS